MEQEKINQVEQRSGSPEGTDAQSESSYDLTVRRVNKNTAMHSSPYSLPEPAVLLIRDLLDLPRQILPEQTYKHLKNAGKEAFFGRGQPTEQS